MGEVHHPDDAEHHCIADGDQAVDRPKRDAVDDLLDENFHCPIALSWPRPRQERKLYQGGRIAAMSVFSTTRTDPRMRNRRPHGAFCLSIMVNSLMRRLRRCVEPDGEDWYSRARDEEAVSCGLLVTLCDLRSPRLGSRLIDLTAVPASVLLGLLPRPLTLS